MSHHMTAAVQTITATILIQVGADKPKPIGTIQIPIEVTVGGNQQLTVLHNGVPGARNLPPGFRPYRGDPNDEPPVPDDEAMTAEQVRARFPINPLGAH